MKLRTLLVALTVAAVAVTAAAAAAPPGKGKPAASGTGCKPMVAVIISGQLAGNGATAPSTLSVKAAHGNHYATAYLKLTQPISIAVTTITKINRQGDHNPADLKSGDRVNIQARACKADLANSATPNLTATRITAHPSS